MLDWSKLCRQAFLEPYAFWAGIALVLFFALNLVRNRHQPQRKQMSPLILLCVAQIAFVLLSVFVKYHVVESRYLLPLLPCFHDSSDVAGFGCTEACSAFGNCRSILDAMDYRELGRCGE